MLQRPVELLDVKLLSLKRILTKESVSSAMVQAGFPSSRPAFCYPLLFLQVIHIDKTANHIFLITKFRCRSRLTVWGFILIRFHVYGTSSYMYN